MSNATVVNSANLGNHELQKLVEKTVELLKLSVVQGVNGVMNPQVYKFKSSEISVGGRVRQSYQSVEQVVSERVRALDPARINALRLSLGRDSKITALSRSLNFAMREEKSPFEQLDLKSHYSFVNDTTFNETTVLKMVNDLSISATDESTVSAGERLTSELRGLTVRYGHILTPDVIDRVIDRVRLPEHVASLNKSVRFRVHEVKCIDETNPEWAGHDEIAWGGAWVDDKGSTGKIDEKKVGGGFDDGDRKSYNPPEIIHTFQLDNTYPKEFLVTMCLAEKDSGGLSRFIQKLYEAVKAQLTNILTVLGAAAGAYIGAHIGGSIGTAVGGPLGTVIGIVAGAILGALIAWLVGILGDDIFSPEASTLTLPTPDTVFGDGGLISARQSFHYRDHGGHYKITYDWEITR